MLRKSAAIGALVIALIIVSVTETDSIGRTIYQQLDELQQELQNTHQQFDSHLAWNNLIREISLDTSTFLLEFELLTIDPERSDHKIAWLTGRFKQHYSSFNQQVINESQQANIDQLRRGLRTLEDIGLELLDTMATNQRLQLYRDSIEYVDAVNNNAQSINIETIALTNTLKQRIDAVVHHSLKNQGQLGHLLDRHNLVIIAFSALCFVIVMVAFLNLFKLISERISLLEQYSHDIGNQDYRRPPFSSKDITGRLAVRMGLMARTIRSALTTLQQSTREIEELAYYDTLTGLENRRLFNENLEKAVLLSRRYNEKYALVYLDLDYFKNINDNYGHEAGDKVLVRVARRLHLTLREEDRIARLGGDEFAMLLRSDNIDITDLIERIIKAIHQPIVESKYELKISASIGIAILGVDADNLSDLMRYADMALYKAKENGRNTYHYFSEQLETRTVKKHKILKELVAAIEDDQLELFYQTQHDMSDRRIIGVEALIRWPLADGGFMFPDEFIPLAEESGLIMPLGEWIIHRACRDGKLLNELAGPLTISINLSTKQFEDPELLNKIIHSCKVYELPHNSVDLEVTESLLLNDMDLAVKTLNSMRKQGFNISLDDFGTGYSSLFYLKNLPVTNVKIDKSFTSGVPAVEKDSAIIETTIQLAHRLNLKVVVEGIETEEQFSCLQGYQCDTAQGYLLGKPQPLNELIERLEQKLICA